MMLLLLFAVNRWVEGNNRGQTAFTRSESESCLREMEDANQIMVSWEEELDDGGLGMVYRI